jgi:hypothetical protein
LKPLKKAKYIILGSFLNLGEVYDSCLRAKRDVVIACAGGQEDVIFAGMLVDFLQSTLGTVPVVLAESAKEAMSQYKPWQGRLVDLLRQCEEGKELIKEGFSKDLDFCSKVNKTSVVPYLKEGQLFVKENTPKPRKPLIVDGKSKGGGVVQKGKSIKITAPLFPKNPEHPVPGMEKGSSKKHATPPTPVDKKAALKKGEAKETHGKKMDHPKEASPAKSKRAPAKPTAMFSKKTVATAVVSLKKETAKTKK